MKVIKEGSGQKGWSKKFECSGAGNDGGGCGAVLLVEQGDLFKTTSHARNETTTYVTFKCCECGVLTDIWCDEGRSKTNLPHHIIRNLPTRNPGSMRSHPRD